MKTCTRKMLCLMVLAILILLSSSVLAQYRGKSNARITRAVDMNFQLLTNQSFSGSLIPADIRGSLHDTVLNYAQTGGFGAMFTVNRQIFSLGLFFRNYSDQGGNRRYSSATSSSPGESCELEMGRTQFGVVGALSTQYFQPTRGHSWFWLQVSMGGAFDVFGREVRIIHGEGPFDPMEEYDMGQLREHHFFLNLRITMQNPYTDRFGLFYIGPQVSRSVYTWSPKDSAGPFNFKEEGVWHLALVAGISL